MTNERIEKPDDYEKPKLFTPGPKSDGPAALKGWRR